MIPLALLLTLALVPCDLDLDQQTYSPTPVLEWDSTAEPIDGHRLYFWPADESKGETWRLASCWWYPDDWDLYGDMAGTRFCSGDDQSLPVPLQRYISFDPAQDINVCVTAVREGLESVDCSNVVTVCWPEERSF